MKTISKSKANKQDIKHRHQYTFLLASTDVISEVEELAIVEKQPIAVMNFQYNVNSEITLNDEVASSEDEEELPVNYMGENNSEETNTTVINNTWDNSINEVEAINNSGDVINEVVELNNDTSDHYDDSNMNEELI